MSYWSRGLGLLLGGTLAWLGASAAGAQTPSNKQLYEMLLKQQKEIRQLRQELRRARNALQRHRGTTARTTKAATDANKAAAAARRAAREANSAITKIRRDGTRVATRTERQPFITFAKQDGAQFYLGVVALKPTSEFLDYGIFSPDGGTPAVAPGSRVLSANTGYAPGVRAGFGYAFGASGSDVRFLVTHVQNSWTTATNVAAPASVLAILANPAATGADDAFDATANYSFQYFVADLEAGQTLKLGSHLKVRLLAGLRFARVAEEFTVLYQNRNFGPQGDLVTNENKFWGIGPRVGASFAWRAFGAFYVAADVDVSLLLGSFDVLHRQQILDLGLTIANIEQSNKGVLVPVVGARLAFGWKGPVADGIWLVVEVGYEFQAWMGAARRINNVDDINGATLVRQKSDLFLHGPYLMFRVKFDNLGMLLGL